MFSHQSGNLEALYFHTEAGSPCSACDHSLHINVLPALA